ncbi:MAG: histidine phosphatase family protein [Bdellovibrionota bacterium]
MSASRIEIYAFRHGQTDWNLIKKFQGHTDIPLNEEGVRQARALAPLFKGLPITAILSSDLSRAACTAEIVAEHHGLPLILDRRLREAHFGNIEGMTKDEVVAQLGEESWTRWMSMTPENMDFSFPGGESKRQFLARVQQCLHEFAENAPQDCAIALSTHGAVLKRLVQISLNAPVEDFWISNCDVHRLVYEPRSRSWTYDAKVLEIG